jgi:hypothetical protein
MLNLAKALPKPANLCAIFEINQYSVLFCLLRSLLARQLHANNRSKQKSSILLIYPESRSGIKMLKRVCLNAPLEGRIPGARGATQNCTSRKLVSIVPIAC